jgi:serine/threonine kinase PknH
MTYLPYTPPPRGYGHGYGQAGTGGNPPNQGIDPLAATRARPIPPPAGRYPIPPHATIPGFPPPGYPRPPQRDSRRMWGALAGGFAVVVIAVTIVVVLVAGPASQQQDASAGSETAPASPSTSAPPAMVDVSALPGLLLDAATINTLEGAIAMQVQPDPKPTIPYTGGETNRPECAGLYHPATRVALEGSGWVAMQSQYLREPGDDWRHAVTQTVISYPNAQGAADFAAGQARNWAKCAGRSITVTTPKDGPVTWSVGRTGTNDGVLTAVLTQEGAAGWACQRALVARGNVAVDIRSCGDNIVDQAGAIARKIAGGIVTA